MNELKIFSIKKNIHEDNAKVANETREILKRNNSYLINIMSSPGSGKTTTLVSTINALKEEMRIGVIEADVDSDVDARTVQNAGAKAVQMHTGGLCHLDATMTQTGINELGVSFMELKTHLQKHIRDYNINNKLSYSGELYSPVEYHVKSKNTEMVLPLWAYIERGY